MADSPTPNVAPKRVATAAPSPPPAGTFRFEYAPAPESTAVVTLREHYGLFIGGKFVEPVNGGSFVTINPANEQPLALVALGEQADVDAAVRAARRAFSRWSALAGKERAKYLYRIARVLQERAREFAVLETMNGGKPIKESRDVDIPLAAAHFFHYAGWADKLAYAFPGTTPRPLGVAGQVIPWNFPLLMAACAHRRAATKADWPMTARRRPFVVRRPTSSSACAECDGLARPVPKAFSRGGNRRACQRTTFPTAHFPVP